MSWDFSVKNELNDFVAESMRAVSIDFLNRVTLASPADTGRFRANWVVGVGSPDASVNYRYTSQNNQLTRNRKKIKTAFKNDAYAHTSIFISNNLPYAQRLNNGHSKQAPSFFVEIAAREAGINVKDGDFAEDVK